MNQRKSYSLKETEQALKIKNKELLIAKEQAEQSEKRLREAQKLANLGSWEYIVEPESVTWSEELHNIFEYPSHLGAPPYSQQKPFYTAESFARMDKAVENCLLHGTPYKEELTIITSSGTTKYIISKGEALYDENNQIIGCFGVALDITRQKLLEVELVQARENAEKSEANVKAIIDGTSNSIWAFDRNYKILYINHIFQQEFLLSFGINLEVGMNLLDSLPEPLRPIWKPRYDKVLANEYFRIEDAVPTDAGAVYIEVTFNPIVKNGKVIGGSCFGNDITARKNNEIQLEQAKLKAEDGQANIRAIIEGSNNSIWAFNRDYEILYVNKLFQDEFFETFGVLLKPGMNIIDAHPKELLPVWKPRYDRVLRNEQYKVEDAIPNNDRTMYVEVAFNPIVQNGKVIGASCIGRNITNRIESEKAIRESQNLLLSIAENYPHSYVSVIDKDLTVGFTSGQEFKRNGLNPNDFVGLTLEQVFGEHTEFVTEQYKRTFQGEEMEFELFINNENQFYRTVPIYNEQNEVEKILAVAENITERRRMEDELKENEAQIRLIGDNIPKGQIYQVLVKADGSSWFTYVSNKIEELHECTAEEALANPALLYDRIIPEDRSELRTATMEAAKELKVLDQTFRVIRKSGEIRWHRMVSTPRRTKDGNILLDGIDLDITEFIEAQQKVVEGKKEFQTWIQNTPVCTKKIDIDFNLQYMSEAGIRELKVDDVNKLYGTPYPFNFFPEDTQNLMQEKMEEAKESGETTQIDSILSDTKGNNMWYNHIIVPVKKSGEELDYLLIISSDISERKKTEIELIKAKEKAEESDRLKSSFLANMSHEIRTPMNGILGFTELLEIPNLSGEEQEKYIEIIKQSGERMLDTVNDIIDISKIDAGQVIVSTEAVNISKEIETHYQFFKEEAGRKGLNIKLNNEFSDGLTTLMTDKNKLNSAITNLMKNAIKYTNEGSIEISCAKKDSKLEIKVTDTGIGIPDNKIESIFNRFEQADVTTTRSKEGSGLGLSISKAYIEMLSGFIGVHSEEGKGSTFYFSIPWLDKKEDDPN